MKEYKSSLYGHIKEPENIIELFELLTGCSNENHRTIKVWRGQANVDWTIDSGAYRRLYEQNHNVTEFNMLTYENSLLSRARHKGYGFDKGILLGDMELLAKLQHHGAATRLVDFSKNSLVALYFCVNSVTKDYGLLLGIDTDYIGGMEGVLDEENKNYSSTMGDLEEYDYPILIEPPVVSKRIAAQHGVFLFSDVANDIKGSLKIPKDGDNIFIAISPELKKKSRQILIDAFDIREETLFPDLDGFSFANNYKRHPNEAYRW